MKKYVFDVSLVATATAVEVAAENREDAEEKIRKMINDEEIEFYPQPPEYDFDLVWTSDYEPLHHAIDLITTYYKEEFGPDHPPVDLKKLNNIGLAYTSFEEEPERFGDNDEHFIQISVDLASDKPSMFWLMDEKEICRDIFDSIEELIEQELLYIDFNDLTTRWPDPVKEDEIRDAQS